MDVSRDQIEEALKRSLVRDREGPLASRHLLTSRLVMAELCPDHERGYRWSATSNYLRACMRALEEGRGQPNSRGRQLDEQERERVWELVQAAFSFWRALLESVGAFGESGRVVVSREDLLATELGRRLFAFKPEQRLRPSALAA